MGLALLGQLIDMLQLLVFEDLVLFVVGGLPDPGLGEALGKDRIIFLPGAVGPKNNLLLTNIRFEDEDAFSDSINSDSEIISG